MAKVKMDWGLIEWDTATDRATITLRAVEAPPRPESVQRDLWYEAPTAYASISFEVPIRRAVVAEQTALEQRVMEDGTNAFFKWRYDGTQWVDTGIRVNHDGTPYVP